MDRTQSGAHPVRAAGMQVGDVLALGVQRAPAVITTPVRSMPVRVSTLAGEPVDLAGLAVHAELSEHDPGVLIDHRAQMLDLAGASLGE
jgi:hypothetical protein